MQNEYIKECLERIDTSDYKSNLFNECLRCAQIAKKNDIDWQIASLDYKTIILELIDHNWPDGIEEDELYLNYEGYEDEYVIRTVANLEHILPILGFDTANSLEMFLKDYFEANQMLY